MIQNTPVELMKSRQVVASPAEDRVPVGHALSRSPHGKPAKRLPEYLGAAKVVELIRAAPDELSRLAMLAQWRAGLRMGEALTLCFEDIDDEVLRVRQGKGNKQRMVRVHPELAAALRVSRDFRRATGSDRIVPMSKRTYQRRFREAVARAGFPGRITSHTLRHSFARHAIADRVPPSVLQHALGHATCQQR